MPRNGSTGSYTLPDTLVPGTLADANEVMTVLNDIASAMTDSVAADGQTSITGQLKGFVAATPTYSFSADADTGMGSDAANQVFIKAGNTSIMTGTTSGMNFPLALTKGGVSVDAFPTGTTMIFNQTTAPTGWTKNVSIDNSALRLVSGTATTGGSANFSTVFTSRTPTGNNSSSSISGFVTVGRDGWGSGAVGGASGRLITSNGQNSVDGDFLAATVDKTDAFINSGTAAAQTFTGNSMDFAVKFVDVIRASKD